MNFFKKLFGMLRKSNKTEKKKECWYNNAHENGEAVRNSSPLESGGSEHTLESAVTSMCVRK